MKNLKKVFHKYNKSVEKTKVQYSGLLGMIINGAKRVNHPTRVNYVYVRLRDNLSETVVAFNDKVSAAYDVPVLIERKKNKWVVLGRDVNRYEKWSNTVATPYLPKHGNQHSLNRQGVVGADPVWVFPDQFMPLLVYPSGSAIGSDGYIVSPYVLQRASDFIYVGNTGTIGVKQYAPTVSGTAYMGLVYLDRLTGNPGVLIASGTPMDTNFSSFPEVLPYVPYPVSSDQEPLYAFKLVSGSATVNWDNLYNVRQFFGGGGTGGGISDAPNDGLYYGRRNLGWTDLKAYFDTVYAATGTAGGTGDHESLTGLLGGTSNNHWHLSSPQTAGLVSGSVTSLHSHSGTASDVIFGMDGVLFATTGSALPYLITRPTTIDTWYIYSEKRGMPSGTIIADVNLYRGGVSTTIFTNQANRPMLAFEDSDGWASTTPGLVNFLEGDILVPDIDQISTGSSGLVLVGKIAGVGASSPGLVVKDGSTTVANVNTITASGAVVTTTGQGLATITVSPSASPVLDAYGTATTVSNTGSETDIYAGITVAGGVLGANGMIRMTCIANINHAVAGTLTLRFKYGGTTISTLLIAEGSVTADKQAIIKFYLTGKNNTAQQHGQALAEMIDAATVIKAAWGNGTATEDSTTGLALKVTAQWNTPTTNLSVTFHSVVVEVLNA
jgi:hypothetical protein